MSRRMRWSERIAALEQLVAVGGGGGSTGGDGGGGLDTAAVEAIVDQKIADLPAPSGGGGGGSETGLVLAIEDATSFLIDTLPAGEEFEIQLDGTIVSTKLQITDTQVSFAKQTGPGGPNYMMMVDPRGAGQKAHEVPQSYYGWVAATNQEFLDFCAANPGALRLVYDYGNNTGGDPNYNYRFAAVRQLGDDQVGPLTSASDPASMPGGPTLAKWNAKLTGFGLLPWSDLSHPIKAEINGPKNITLRPNNVASGTVGMVTGSDGVGDDKVSLTDAGIVIARPYSGEWQVLSKTHLSIGRRLVSGTMFGKEVGGTLKRGFLVGGSWDNLAAIDSLGLDFGGGTFDGTVSIVPKAVVAA